MTEQEIIYSILETIRNNEILDDDKTTESFLRNLLYAYRADAIKNDLDISEEVFQSFMLKFEKKDLNNGIFESINLPDIIYNIHRNGIVISDLYGTEVSIVPREEAIISQRSRFFKPLYVAYIQSQKMVLRANLKGLSQSNKLNNELLKTLVSDQPEIEISCILTNPNDSPGYDWKMNAFPFPSQKISSVKQKILRQEFGVMMEVKKDEIQNSRADNIIYQDESKLYK